MSRSLANRRLWSLREYSTLARFRIIEHDCSRTKTESSFRRTGMAAFDGRLTHPSGFAFEAFEESMQGFQKLWFSTSFTQGIQILALKPVKACILKMRILGWAALHSLQALEGHALCWRSISSRHSGLG